MTPWTANPTATIVLATQPGDAASAPDGRRLYRLINAADASLTSLGIDRSASAAIVRRLQQLAMTTVTLPAGDGFTLVATPTSSDLFHLRGPVEERVVIGGRPDLRGAARWTAGRLAVLVLSADRARLLVANRSRLAETVDHGFPVLRPGTDVDDALVEALPEGMPLVVAGDDPLTFAFYDGSARRRDIAGVLPGDHATTSAAALFAMARRIRRHQPAPAVRA